MSGKLHWSEKRQFLDGFLVLSLIFANHPDRHYVGFDMPRFVRPNFDSFIFMCLCGKEIDRLRSFLPLGFWQA
jgi:hypothetical protein